MQGQGCNWGVANKEKHPINGVNWYQPKPTANGRRGSR